VDDGEGAEAEAAEVLGGVQSGDSVPWIRALTNWEIDLCRNYLLPTMPDRRGDDFVFEASIRESRYWTLPESARSE
jgi:hypothetical protein